MQKHIDNRYIITYNTLNNKHSTHKGESDMTFQEIVEKMVREDSEEWVMDLLFESGNKTNVSAEEIKFGNIADGKVYFCKVAILDDFNSSVDSVEVSGTVTYRGVNHAQIRHNGKTIWHNSSFIREDMGIKEFRI